MAKGKKVRINDKPYVKEDYSNLNLAGTPSHYCEVNDDVFDATKGIIRPFMAPIMSKEPGPLREKNNYQGKLELYTGDLKKMLDRPQKKENVPLSKPFKQPYIMNKNDIYNRASAEARTRSYDNSLLAPRSFERPVEPIRVKPGIGLGYTAEGDPNPFHSLWRPPVKTVDELRGWIRPSFDISRFNQGVDQNAPDYIPQLEPKDVNKKRQTLKKELKGMLPNAELDLGYNPATNPYKSKAKRQDAVYGVGIRSTIIPSIFKSADVRCDPEKLDEKNKKKLVIKSRTISSFTNAGGKCDPESLDEKNRKKLIIKSRTINPFMNVSIGNETDYDIELKERRTPVIKGQMGQLKPLYYLSHNPETLGRQNDSKKKEKVIMGGDRINVETENVGVLSKLMGLITKRTPRKDVLNSNKPQIESASLKVHDGRQVDVQFKNKKELAYVKNNRSIITNNTAGAKNRARINQKGKKAQQSNERTSTLFNVESRPHMPRGDLKDVKIGNKPVFQMDIDIGPKVQGHVRAPEMVPLNRIAPDANPVIYPPTTAPELAGMNNKIILGENTRKNRKILYGNRNEPNNFSMLGL